MQILLVAIAFCVASAEVGIENNARLSCSETIENIVSINEVLDPVNGFSSSEGRYEVRYCRQARGNVTWYLGVSLLDGLGPHNCSKEQSKAKRRTPALKAFMAGDPHSSLSENIDLNLNCTHAVCISKYLDLMFHGCYYVHSRVGPEGNHTYFFVNNSIPGSEYFIQYNYTYLSHDNDDEVKIEWYHERIPITEYDMRMTTVTDVHEYSMQEVVNVTPNCSVDASNLLSCSLLVAPARYRLQLWHTAPWAQAPMFQPVARVHVYFNHSLANPVSSSPSPADLSGAWMALAGCLVLCGGGLAGLAVWRSRLAGKVRRRVQEHLQHGELERAATEFASSCPPAPRILLIYAREGDRAIPAQDALKRLLELVAPGQVYDVHTAETLSLMTPSPPDWLRMSLCSPHTRVLVLQSPAARCMLMPATDAPGHMPPEDNLVRVHSPLLPRRALYRRPQYSDQLVQMSLRLIADVTHERDDIYRRFFIATYSELQTELFPHVCAFRRYLLPATTSSLLQDLSGRPVHATQLNELLFAYEEAVREFVSYVADNENYLADEIMFP